MTFTMTRTPATIDALVATWTDAGVKVHDGPQLSGDFEDCIFVGFDGNPEGEYQSAEVEQDWAGLGAKHRSETLTIICSAVVLNGDDNIKAARDTAYGFVETAGIALRNDPSLGQPPPFVAGLRPGPLFIEPTQQGVQVRVVFSVNVTIARV